jgi:hypothetical protein
MLNDTLLPFSFQPSGVRNHRCVPFRRPDLSTRRSARAAEAKMKCRIDRQHGIMADAPLPISHSGLSSPMIQFMTDRTQEWECCMKKKPIATLLAALVAPAVLVRNASDGR